MWWAVGTVAALAVLSTTRQDRLNARRRLARWNSILYALCAVGFAGLLIMLFGG